ncbi:MocR-like pyridoxine biosynthesis transcription factor PdxR [Anaeromicrobium sediminis]|uniref:Transcriptional regulator n=1 Tax=Anaeromicrobium sediminis TaxID=1478221 RepID=A0A267MHZ9_9FIRM|nr:PLP-dependent aminotransferase family protein [Anaeromicrobium sediminis]PAB59199.1 transcriptional regulator [Anaeromicrobium sediminis]
MEKFNKNTLDKRKPQHLYVQLFNLIRDIIIRGELKDHYKLPPIRSLAGRLEVNNSTVVNAYRLLEKEGYVYKKIGSGTFVSPRLEYDNEDVILEKYPAKDDLKLMDQGQIQIRKDMISFASATPTPDLFPVEAFKVLLNEVLDRDKGEVFGYQESQGYFPLRESLTKYLKNYNIETKPENVQIISGAQQGIDVIAKALVEYNDRVIVESPTYTGAIGTFRSRGAQIISIPILEDGIDIKKLEESVRVNKPKLIYLMPNFQNPTGYSYSLEKKKKILEIAKKYNVLIVEDDYLSDLVFNKKENGTLKSLDKDGLVIYIKSFSKIFMPGLRLGFLVMPPRVYHKILRAKHTSDISTSGLNQRVFDLYLRRDIWRDHIHHMEKIYKIRFEVMCKSISKYFSESGLEYNIPNGGLNFWFKLPEGLNSDDIYDKAVKKNVLIIPGNIFFPIVNENSYFRLSIAAVYPEQIEEGIRILANIIKGYNKEHIRDSYTPLL